MRISAASLTRAAIALVLGAAAWMLITWEQNPFREDWLSSTVPIEVSHLPSGVVEVGKPGDVRVRLRAGQDAWSRVQASDFKASVDLTKVGAGIHSADVRVESSGDYQVVDWEPRHVTVRLEPLIQRDVPVELQLSGKLPDGYSVRTQTVTPDHVTITGQQDLAQAVAQASVTANLDGVRGNVTDSVAPKLLDDKGQPVPNVQLTPATVRISIEIDRQVGVKTVPVRVTTSGQVATGYWLSSLNVNPQTVTITGGPTALGQVDYIDVPPLDLGGAKANVSRKTTLAAGAGYSIVGTPDVEVTAVIQPLRTTEVLPLGIAVQGLGGGLEARLQPATVEVTLGGLVPALSALKPGDVSAVIDVSGLGPGLHTVPIRLNAPASVALDATRPDRVTVTLIPPATATATAPATTATPGAGGSPSSSASAAPSATPTGAPASSPAVRSQAVPSSSSTPNPTPAR